jgi:uncharacterized protein DUF5681
MSDPFERPVGYMNPPEHSRFKKGKSGNPKGRPKKQEDIHTVLQRVLNRKVRVNGAERKIPIREALIRKLREVALSGHPRAMSLQRRILDEAGLNQIDPYEPEEIKQKVLDAFRKMGVKVIEDEEDNG